MTHPVKVIKVNYLKSIKTINRVVIKKKHSDMIKCAIKSVIFP